MAKSTQVILCKRCNVELPENTSTCAACGFNPYPQIESRFGSPDYVVSQYQKLKEEIEQETKGDSEKEKEQDLLFADYDKWLLNCPETDYIECLSESLEMVSRILHTKATPDTIKAVVTIGKRIGEMSTIIDSYVSKGGKLYGKISKSTRPHDNIEGGETS